MLNFNNNNSNIVNGSTTIGKMISDQQQISQSQPQQHQQKQTMEVLPLLIRSIPLSKWPVGCKPTDQKQTLISDGAVSTFIATIVNSNKNDKQSILETAATSSTTSNNDKDQLQIMHISGVQSLLSANRRRGSTSSTSNDLDLFKTLNDNQQGVSTSATTATASSSSSSSISNDIDIILLNDIVNQTVSNQLSTIGDRLQWCRPLAYNSSISLYSSEYESSLTVPAILAFTSSTTASQTTLHLLSLFKDSSLVNNINSSNSSNVTSNKYKVKKQLTVISTINSDLHGTSKLFNQQQFQCHSFSVSYNQLLSLIEVEPNVNEKVNLQIIPSDKVGQLVILINYIRVVVLKIKQIEFNRIVVYIDRYFNLSSIIDDDEEEEEEEQEREEEEGEEQEENNNHHEGKDNLQICKSIDKWLFVFKRNSIQSQHLDIWSLNGKQRGSIDLLDYLDKYHLFNDDNEKQLSIIKDISISSDRELVTLLDDRNRIFVISLDHYFQEVEQPSYHTKHLICFESNFNVDLDDVFSSSSESIVMNGLNGINNNGYQHQSHGSSGRISSIEDGRDITESSHSHDDHTETEDTDDNSSDSFVDDLDDCQDLFLLHWYESEDSKTMPMDATKEYDAMVSWLPNHPIQYPSNGFKIYNHNINSNSISSQHTFDSQQSTSYHSKRQLSRESSFSISRSVSNQDFSMGGSYINNSILQNQNQLDIEKNLLNESQLIAKQQQQQNEISDDIFNLNCYSLTKNELISYNNSNSSNNINSDQSSFNYFNNQMILVNEKVWTTPLVIVYQRDYIDRDSPSKTSTEFNLIHRLDPLQKQSHHYFTERMQVVLLGDQSFFYLSSTGLNVILMDQNQQQILNNLIMFEGSASANHLCEINNWNKRDLKIHALQLGLKYRQLDVVEPALKSLDLDQQLIGSRLLVNTILEHTANASNANVHNESFTSELLHIGMNFIGLIIKDRASLVHAAIPNLGDINFNWTETLTTPLNQSNLTLSSLNVILSPSHNNSNNSNVNSNSNHSGNHQTTESLFNLTSIDDINSPIQDLLNFTTILEAFRMFQKQQQPSSKAKANMSYANRAAVSIPGSTNTSQLLSNGNPNLNSNAILLSADEIDMGPWFGGLCERWERMEELELVKESLSNNTVSSAIAFINWKRERNGMLLSSSQMMEIDGSGPVSNNNQLTGSGVASQQSGTNQLPKIIPATGTFTLAHFQQIAACLVYQAISQAQLEPALDYLAHLGQPIVPHLRQIALATSRRSIRSLLLDALGNHPKAMDRSIFSDEFLELMSFAKQIEALYPNPSYYREFSRLSFRYRPFHETRPPPLLQTSQSPTILPRHASFESQTIDDDLKPLCQEVDDILPDTENNYGFHIVTHNIGGSSNNIYQQTNQFLQAQLIRQVADAGRRITLYPPIKNDVQPTIQDNNDIGYSHFTLNWASKWSHLTKERILIDRNFEMEKRDRLARLYFAVSHSRSQDVISWVDNELTASELQYFRSLILSSQQLDRYQSSSTIPTAIQPPSQSTLDLHKSIYQDMSIALPFIKDMFLNQMARHRIFLLDMETSPLFYIDNRNKSINNNSNNNNNINNNDMMILLKRLSSTHQLFPVVNNGIIQPHSYPLNLILPIGETSAFHRFFINFCIENRNMMLLTAYLQSYQLATQVAVRSQHIGFDQLDLLSSESQLLFLLRTRSPADLLRANVVNMAMTLNLTPPLESTGIDGFLSTLNSAIAADRPLLTLAAMIYAPSSIASVLTEVTDRGTKLDTTPLLQAFKQNPTLFSKLASIINKQSTSYSNKQQKRMISSSKPRDIISSKSDITLSELIEATSTFSLASLFGAVGTDPLSVRVPDIATQSFKEAYIDRIDVFYYLEKGRPMRAYQFLQKRFSKGTDQQIRLSNENISLIGWLMRSFILHRVGDETSVGSAISLLELMNLKFLATMLKVDYSVAKRIIDHSQTNNNTSSKDDFESNSFDLVDLISVFLSIYPTPSTLPLKQESVAKSMPIVPGTPIGKIISAFESTLQLDEPLSESNSNWAVLSRFCQVHSVSLVTRRLEYLARQDNWLAFLYEAQQHQFQMSQISKTVRLFSNSSIRSHLALILEQISQQRMRVHDSEPPKTESELIALSIEFNPIEPTRMSNDIMDYLLSSYRTTDPANYLLYYAITHERALLAVLASMSAAQLKQTDINTNVCLVTWLCVSIPSLATHLSNVSTTVKQQQQIQFNTGVDSDEESDQIPQQTKWTVDDLHQSIHFIVQNRKTFVLLQGLKIFLPQSPLMSFLKFISQFHQYRFEDSEKSLQLFIQDLSSQQDQSIKKLAIDVCEGLLDLYSSYEREHFLDILHRSNLSNNFSTLYSTLHLMKRTMLEDKNIRLDPKVIIDRLLEKNLFTEARTYSNENHLDKDIITLAEVESLVSHYKHGCLWELEQERINLWKKCQHYFSIHQCRPEVAGDFFQQISQKLPPSNEKVFLLQTTVDWLEMRANINSLQMQHIEDLKKQILLISVGLSLEESEQANNDESRDSTSTSVSPSTSPYRPSHMPHSSFTSPLQSPSTSLSSSPDNFDPNPFRKYNNNNNNNNNNRYSVSPPSSSSVIPMSNFTPISTPSAYLSPTKPPRSGVVDPMSIDPKGLDNVIAKLLNSGNYTQAEQISKQFSFKSVDYEIILTMISVANKTISPSPHSFSPTILAVLENSFNGLKWLKQQNEQQPSISSNNNNNGFSLISTSMNTSGTGGNGTLNPIASALEALSSCCNLAKEAAKSILTKYNVCQKLSMNYTDLQLENHYDIVNLLLLQGKECFRLVKSYLSTNHLDLPRVNLQLADTFAKAVKSMFPVKSSLTKSISNSNISSISPTPTSSSLSSSFLTNSNDSISSGIDPNWTSEEFHEYARLGRDPFTFGMRLLEATGIDFDKATVTSSPIIAKPNSLSPNGMEAEVELFVRAHFCFVIACSVDGSILVQNIVKSRINYYADAGQFKLLVRLITGMQCYNELQGILDILLQHDSFELLLRKKIHQHEDRHGLKLALHSYLLKKQPLYQEKLEMLFYRFNMYREIAALHEHRAKQQLESIVRDPKQPVNNFIRDLLVIMESFLNAADNYAKERSNRTSQYCVAMGTLVGLQIKLPDTKLINLKLSEARQTLFSRQSFRESLIIANAYNLNIYSEWINVLFQQVICNGNFSFLQDYIANFSIQQNLFHDLIKKFKTDTSKQAKVQHVKYLLNNFVIDKHLRYDLAKEMNFEDIISQTVNSTLGINYFKSSGGMPTKK